MTRPSIEDKGRGLREKKPSLKRQDILASEAHQSVTPSDSETEMAQRRKRAASPPDMAPFASKAPKTAISDFEEAMKLPSFTSAETMIYLWPAPWPRTFAPLPQHLRAWKDRRDAAEKAADVDDGADDWDAFAGMEDGRNTDEVYYAAASVFVKRAKRAFWAGKTWSAFVEDEIAAETSLANNDFPNDDRLAVLDKLQKRLCEEIWSRELPPPPPRLDSKIPTPETEPQHVVAAPRKAGPSKPRTTPGTPHIDPPTAAQKAQGITRVHVDATGLRQPLCGEETAPPGMAALRAAVRADNRQIQTEIGSGERSARVTREELRWASFRGVGVGGGRGRGREDASVPFEVGVLRAREEMETSDEGEGRDDDDDEAGGGGGGGGGG